MTNKSSGIDRKSILQIDSNSVLDLEEIKIIEKLSKDEVLSYLKKKDYNGVSIDTIFQDLVKFNEHQIIKKYGSSSKYWGSELIGLLQVYLNMTNGSQLKIDGKFGKNTYKALNSKKEPAETTEDSLDSNINNRNGKVQLRLGVDTRTKFINDYRKSNKGISREELNKVVQEVSFSNINADLINGKIIYKGVQIFIDKNDEIISTDLEGLNSSQEIKELDKQKDGEIKDVKEQFKKEISTHKKAIIESVKYGKYDYIDASLLENLKKENLSFDDRNSAIGNYLKQGITNFDVLKVLNDDEVNFDGFCRVINNYINNYSDIKDKIYKEKGNVRVNESEIWTNAGYSHHGMFYNPAEIKQLSILTDYYKSDKTFKSLVDNYNQLFNRGVDFVQYNNSKTILSNITYEKLFNFIADYNNDGVVDEKDKGSLFGSQIQDLLLDMERGVLKEQTLVHNILLVIDSSGLKTNKSIKTKKGLYDLFLSKPELKQIFINQLMILSNNGIEPEYLLRRGDNGIVDWMKDRQQMSNHPSFKIIQQSLGEKFEKSLSNLEKQIKNLEKNGSSKEELDRIKSIYSQFSESKNMYIETISIRSFGTFLSFVEGNKGFSQSVGVGSNELDRKIKETTKGFIESVDLSLAYTQSESGQSLIPGIGVNFLGGIKATAAGLGLQKVIDYNNLELIGAIGTFWALPGDVSYSAGFRYQYNQGELDRAGITNYDNVSKKVGGLVTFNPMGHGFLLSLSKDSRAALENDKKRFQEYLGKIFQGISASDDRASIINKLRNNFNGAGINKVDQGYLNQLINNVDSVLSLYKYDNLDLDGRNRLLSNIQGSYVNRLYEQRALHIENKGFEFTDIGAGLMFIGGYFPLPMIGVGFRRTQLDYKDNLSSTRNAEYMIATGVGLSNVEFDESVNGLARMIQDSIGEKEIKVESITDDKGSYIKIGSESGKNIIDRLNFWVHPDIINNIKYENQNLIIGNVGPISYRNIREQRTQKHYLILGSDETIGLQQLKVSQINKLKNNNPEPINIINNINSKNSASVYSDYRNRMVSEYLNNNFDKYLGIHIDNNYKRYIEQFADNYSKGDYRQSCKGLISILKKADLSGTKEIISMIDGNGKISIDELSILSQFKDIFMSDYMIKDKVLSYKQREDTVRLYIDDIFSGKTKLGNIDKITATRVCLGLLNDPTIENWTQSKSLLSQLMGYEKDQDIRVNKGKQLYYMLMPLSVMANTSQPYFESNQTREKKVLDLFKNNGLDVVKIKKYRDQLISKMGNNSSWEIIGDDGLSSIVASYKIGYNSGLDLMPQGVSSIAGGEKILIDEHDEINRKFIIGKILGNKDFSNTIKLGIARGVYGNAGSLNSINDNQLNELLFNGETKLTINGKLSVIRLNREYYFFMYGRCFNESLGIKILNLYVDGKDRGAFSFKSGGFTISQDFDINQQSINLGVIWGDKKPEPTEKPTEKPTEEPTTEPTISPTRPTVPTVPTEPTLPTQPTIPTLPTQPPVIDFPVTDPTISNTLPPINPPSNADE